MLMQWDREREQHVTGERMEETDQGKICFLAHVRLWHQETIIVLTQGRKSCASHSALKDNLVSMRTAGSLPF